MIWRPKIAFSFGIMVFSLGVTHALAQPAGLLTPRQLLGEVRKIERKVRKLRRLRARGRYRKAVLSGAELQKVIEQAALREHPDAELANQQAVWKRLGLLPAAADYKKILSGLSQASSSMAYYDHHSRKLYLHSGARLPAHGPSLAKEVCHALLDQRFRSKKLVAPIKENRDRQLARRALIEGDCAGVMLAYILAPKKGLGALPGGLGKVLRQAAGRQQGSKLGAAPLLVRETLLFPLVRGLQFIQRIRARHPWGVVNKIYRRPPRSTEQVLHPRKYWRKENPARIRPGELPSLADYTKVKKDVLGELILSIYLRQGVSEDGARRAAGGWGGDLLVTYRAASPDAALALVQMTTWDSEADALEFANAQRHVLLARKMKSGSGATGNLWTYSESDSSQWSVQLLGRHVLTLGGFPPGIREKLQLEVWKKWRIRGRRVRTRK